MIATVWTSDTLAAAVALARVENERRCKPRTAPKAEDEYAPWEWPRSDEPRVCVKPMRFRLTRKFNEQWWLESRCFAWEHVGTGAQPGEEVKGFYPDIYLDRKTRTRHPIHWIEPDLAEYKLVPGPPAQLPGRAVYDVLRTGGSGVRRWALLAGDIAFQTAFPIRSLLVTREDLECAHTFLADHRTQTLRPLVVQW